MSGAQVGPLPAAGYDAAMRATERMRRLRHAEAMNPWGLTRDTFYWFTHLLFLCVGALLLAALASDGPSGVVDTVIAIGLVLLMALAVPLFALGAAGAPPEPLISAALPPMVIFALPWRDIHFAAIPTLVWLIVHALVVLRFLLRQATGSPPQLPRPPRTAR